MLRHVISRSAEVGGLLKKICEARCEWRCRRTEEASFSAAVHFREFADGITYDDAE